MSEVNWRIGHLDHLESPFGNAGGVIKRPEDVEAMAKTGVGWAEHGTTTLEKRYGNDKDAEGNQLYAPGTEDPVAVWYYDHARGEMWNSLGMPNPGMDQVEQDIPEMNKIAEAYGKEIIYNVAPVTSEPVQEAQELVARAYEAGARAVLLNAGCPNVIVGDGGRKEVLCYNPDMLGRVLRGLRMVGVGTKYPKIFLRTSPYPNYDNAKMAYRIIESTDVASAVWTPNSWGGLRPPEDENGKLMIQVPGDVAGKTGPATADDAARQAEMAVRIFNGSGIEVVQSGGIANSKEIGVNAAKQLKRALDLGAVAGAGTTFFYASESGWRYDVDKTLHEFADLP
jgi:dihydroorotate dehydrogenase